MRYVYQDAALVPANWLQTASTISAALDKELSAANRKKLIKARQAHWGALKDALLEMSHNKCWYSEADDCVGDWHVDHFRPKALYDWLAFDWTNYRIAGARPNRQKSDHFPLSAGSTRRTFAARTSVENPVLLDPCVPSDIALVTFDEEGLFKPADKGNAASVERVLTTRDRLELDSQRLVRKRQAVWNRCQDIIDQIREYIHEHQNQSAALTSNTIKNWAGELRIAVSARGPFSSVATKCVHANDAEWILDIPANPAKAKATA